MFSVVWFVESVVFFLLFAALGSLSPAVPFSDETTSSGVDCFSLPQSLEATVPLFLLLRDAISVDGPFFSSSYYGPVQISPSILKQPKSFFIET